MSTSANNPSGTGEESFNAVNAFASLLAVEDGEPAAGEAQEEEREETQNSSESEEEAPAEQDAEEESESEGEEEADEDQQQPNTYRVKIDGQEVEVTLDELQKGYSRTQDYTRKTQALAEQRKAAEAELEQVRQERAYYAQMLEVMQAQIAQQNDEPDWDALYNENPMEWVRQRELFRDKHERAKILQAQQQQLHMAQMRDAEMARQAKLAEEAQKLVEVVPEWKDSKRAAEERGKLVEAALRMGFSENELNMVDDHRALVLLRKAALYDELMGKKGQIKPVPASGPKIAKPGSAGTKPSKKSESARAQERLAKTGSMADAVAAFDAFI